ncbi:hypothetical protein T637_22010 [Enterobacter hormaechei subsp. hoffmannii]|uniref:hypothetical protein n=1 Tax=Enterobacter hormaechei TaxID=158836 RepID=UPI0006275BC4|nr:hypothetical protein [Enterobacter hormaechei]KKJ24085.1 hypothetical protein T637_22010 [Enterobacter hormaechei subsp. hoffmannii]
MTIDTFFIGTRRADKRYGPQSKDMQFSEFIALLSPRQVPTKIVLPDFSGLARHLDEQIKKQFIQQQENEFYRRYRFLSDMWYQAGSISNPENRSRRFEKVMDEALEFIVHSHDLMPDINPNYLKYGDTAEVNSKGRMYCVALLFHIIARAAYEPETVGADRTLPEHCKWMKNWIKNTLGDYFLTNLKINAALYNPDFFPALQRISGESDDYDADKFLAKSIRAARQETGEMINSTFNEHQLKFRYHHFTNEQSEFLMEIRDLHYRVDRIEQLLQDLIENQVVDFSEATAAGKWIDEQVLLLESGNITANLPGSNETKLLPPGL